MTHCAVSPPESLARGGREACDYLRPRYNGSMSRIAYLFERFPSFGQTFCYREVAELVRQGAEVSVFSIRRPSGEPAQDWDEDIVRRVTYLPGEAELVPEIDRAERGGELPDAAVKALREWKRQPDFLRLYQAAHIGLQLRAAGIQRVHAHFAGMAARTAYWLREFFGIEYSLTVHANDIFAPRDFFVSLEKLFATACAVVTVSDFAVEQLRKQFPQFATKFHRVYNGLDSAQFRVAEFRAEVPLILSIGRLIEKKGFADLIAACALLKQRSQEFRCEIIGEGPMEEALHGQISAAHLEGSVRLVGPQTQSEIADRLATATLFILPCRRDAKGDMDNLPTVIMEAMAAGLPVISTPVAGVPEMVEAGVTGELVPADNPAALADTIAALTANFARLRQYGANAREVAGRKFSIQENVASLAAILGHS